MKKIVPLLLIAGIGFYFAAKNFVDSLKVSIAEFRFDSPSTLANGYTRLIFDVGLKIQNPTGAMVSVKSFLFDVFYNGIRVANVSRSTPFHISAKSQLTQNVVLEIPLSLTSVIPVLFGNIKAGVPISFDVSGYLDSALGKFPFKTKVQAL